MKSTNLITIAAAVALLLNTSCSKAKTSETTEGLSDEVIKKKFGRDKITSIKRGTIVQGAGGVIPKGVKVYPIQFNGHTTAYFFQDEFGDWKCNIKGRQTAF